MSEHPMSQHLTMTGSEGDMIRWMYAFNDWTRPQVIAAVGRLSEEQLRQPGAVAGGLGDGSIFASLVHLVDVEESWLARWMGTPEDQEPDPERYRDLASIAAIWEQLNQTRDAWLAGLSGDDLAAPFAEYTTADGAVRLKPLWPALIHVLIHTAHHRGEMYEALTRLGVPPQVEPDLLDFATEQLGIERPFTVRYLPSSTGAPAST